MPDADEIATALATPAAPFTVRQCRLAKVLGWSRRTLHRKVRNGQFPAPAFGTRSAARWLIGDVQRWLTEQRALLAQEVTV